jgi:hypothetical protein
MLIRGSAVPRMIRTGQLIRYDGRHPVTEVLEQRVSRVSTT